MKGTASVAGCEPHQDNASDTTGRGEGRTGASCLNQNAVLTQHERTPFSLLSE